VAGIQRGQTPLNFPTPRRSSFSLDVELLGSRGGAERAEVEAEGTVTTLAFLSPRPSAPPREWLSRAGARDRSVSVEIIEFENQRSLTPLN